MNALICFILLGGFFAVSAGFILGVFYLLPGSLQRSILRYVDGEGEVIHERKEMLPEQPARYKMDA